MKAKQIYTKHYWILSLFEHLKDSGVLKDTPESRELDDWMCFCLDNENIEVEITDKFLEMFLRIKSESDLECSLEKAARLNKTFKFSKKQKEDIVDKVLEDLC